jgi:hypothetical protein
VAKGGRGGGRDRGRGRNADSTAVVQSPSSRVQPSTVAPKAKTRRHTAAANIKDPRSDAPNPTQSSSAGGRKRKRPGEVPLKGAQKKVKSSPGHQHRQPGSSSSKGRSAGQRGADALFAKKKADSQLAFMVKLAQEIQHWIKDSKETPFRLRVSVLCRLHLLALGGFQEDKQPRCASHSRGADQGQAQFHPAKTCRSDGSLGGHV